MKKIYIIAHRGICKKKLDENTIISLSKIKKYKNDNEIKFGIEFDLTLTKDLQVILFHDSEINNKKIVDYNYNELLEYNSNIVLFEDICKEFNNTDYLLDIELKSYDEDYIYNNNLCNLVNKILENYKLNYFISSFDIDIIKKMKILNHFSILIDSINDYVICNYDDISNYKNILGVYTIYDENFDDEMLDTILNKEVKYLITDNVDKLYNNLKN